MMRPTRLKSAGGASDYYGHEDYYITGEANAPSLMWGGKGAEMLGLRGEATKADFRSILEGINPNKDGPAVSRVDQYVRDQQAKLEGKETEALEAAKKDRPDGGEGPDKGDATDPKFTELQAGTEGVALPEGLNHHPGFDLTFSAPKSVSIAAVALERDDLRQAHVDSVKSVMGYIEENHSLSRKREGGESPQAFGTDNLVYAYTVHDYSRAGDADLHAHVVVANMTRDDEGQWRALESKEIFHYQELFSLMYQSELRGQLKDLGYDTIDHPGAAGFFEIDDKHFSVDAIEAASERRNQMLTYFKEMKEKTGQEPTGKQRNEYVNYLKRQSKADTTPEQNFDRVKALAERYGQHFIEFDKMTGRVTNFDHVGELFEKQRGVDLDRAGELQLAKDPEAAMAYALEVVSSGKAVFHKSDVLHAAMKVTHGNFSATELNQTKLMTGPAILSADAYKPRNVTTQIQVDREQDILDHLLAGRGKADGIEARDALALITPERVERILGSGGQLNRGQMEAVITSLSSKDGIVANQGYAGTGKTKGVYAVIADIAKEHGHTVKVLVAGDDKPTIINKIRGIAPTHAAIEELGKVGVEASTVSKFLKDYASARVDMARMKNMRAEYGATDLIVDEGSMLNTNQMLQLANAKEDLGINKIEITGDKSQLGSIGAGGPFRLLLSAQADGAILSTIMRQSNQSDKQAVKAMSDGEIKAAFQLLESRGALVEIKTNDKGNHEPLIKAAVDKWKETGATIITTTNKLRGELNGAVRQVRMEQGEVEPAHDQEVYRPLPVNETQRQHTDNLKVGNYLLFHQSVSKLNIPKHDALKVVALDHKTNRVFFVNEARNLKGSFDLPAACSDGPAYSVVTKDEINIGKNDKMVFRASTPDGVVKNGDEFTVLRFDKTHMHYIDKGGKEQSMPLDSPMMKHLAFGYAKTADMMQGKTTEATIGVVPSLGAGEHVNAARVNVIISRHTEDLTLITDDLKQLKKLTIENNGQNDNAIQHVTAQIQKREGLLDAEQRAAKMGYGKFDAKQIPDAQLQARLGTVVQMGSAPFRNKEGGAKTDFVTLQSVDGKKQTLWSDKLGALLGQNGVTKGDNIQLISTPTPGANEAGIKDNRDWKLNLHEKSIDIQHNKEISEISIPMGGPKHDINIAPAAAPSIGGSAGPRM